MSSSLDLIGGSLEASSEDNRRSSTGSGLGNASTNLIDTEGLLDSVGDGATAAASQQEEELTAEEVLNRLQDAWINEKFSPELLEPQIEVVDCLLDQLDSTDQALKSARGRGAGDKMADTLHQMEMARVRFLISAYLRIRLDKIQKHVHHILEEVKAAANSGQSYRKLTKEELKFANDYKDGLDTLFNQLALSHLPGKAAEFKGAGSKAGSLAAPMPHPNLNAAVFVQAVREVRGVVIEDEAERGRDEEYDMLAGSQHVLNYKCVASLLHKGDVKLV